MYFLFTLLFIFSHSVLCDVNIDPLVKTNIGFIKGLKALDGDYSMFLGIPYAKVNATNAFGASIPVTKFENVFEAYQDAKACPQDDFNGNIVGDLDCLQLNIYVPNSATSQNKVPVMVWVHGGFFLRGTSNRANTGPKFLVRNDVILVTVHYRLGPYGFMCLDTPEVPGNQGLKDQLLALKWVKSNIEAFGGDIDRITLFGVSAGGHSVDLHLISKQENLFNNVIIQSGSSLASTVLIEHDKLAPIKLSKELGYATNSLDDALSYLSNAEPLAVIKARIATRLDFKPCAEKVFDDVEPFITKSWVNTESSVPNIRNLPILVGFNSHELSSTYADKNSEFFDNLNLIYNELHKLFDFNTTELVEMEKNVRNFYISDEGYSKDNKDEIGNFHSDHTYVHPIHRSIKRYLDNSAKSVYLYMFSYRGGRNYMQYGFNDTIDGSVHADELGYLFGNTFDIINITDADQAIIDKMTMMWTNFAKNSDPTPESTELLPVKWLPVWPDRWNYLNINSELKLSSRPYHRRMAFWDLFFKLNGKKQKGYDMNLYD